MFSSWELTITRARGARRARPRLEALEAREVPATQLYATGAGAGAAPHVIVRNAANQIVASFFAYDLGFTGGVEVAMADVNGDGVPDLITGAGPGGGPHVKVFDGAALLSGQQVLLASFMAYDAKFTGGVFVAGGDFNRDGKADVITGAGPGGGPHVKAFNGATIATQNDPNANLLASFMAYDAKFTGGVTVAAEDIGGDNGGTPGGIGSAEIITGAGPGGGPHVKGYSYAPTEAGGADQFVSFMAYDPGFTGGVFVASGFVTNNRDPDNFLYADIITGAGPGGGPHVKVWRLFDFVNNAQGVTIQYLYTEAASFFAFDPSNTSGVRVASNNLGSGVDTIITAVGKSSAPPQVNIFAGQSIGDGVTFTPTLLSTFNAYDAANNGGVFVGGGQKLNGSLALPSFG
jgi:hypothetical protein